MRAAFIVFAVIALVGIGTTEALISNDQLSQLPGRGRPALSFGGAALTIVSVAFSGAVYAALGWFLAREDARESAVLTTGMAAGAGAGVIGGAIRAYLIRDYLGGVLTDYGLADLLVLTLAVFVALSLALSVAAGASLTWLGFRGGRHRPRPRPQS